MRGYLTAVLLLAGSLPAWAESDRAALDLATVLAAESFCGLAFDQAAIAGWIEKNVAADDMGFNSSLRLFVAGKEFEQKSIGPSEKTALCAQTARVARAYGFLK